MGDGVGFVEWKEVFISQVKGHRVVHYYFKDTDGNTVLAIVGTERSVRHMVYVVADEFIHAYASQTNISPGFKWRSKREVVDWLTSSLVQHPFPPDFSMIGPPKTLRKTLGSSDFLMDGFDTLKDHLSDNTSQFASNLKSQSSDICWSGDSWVCTKQLTHYPAFCRNGITISVYSFVFVMAKEENHHLAYLEDMYEDRKGQKKVRARWFHDNREVARVVSLPNRHSKEVFITPHAQVISAECIDGPATVLTPEHYEKCTSALPHVSSGVIHLCSRQFRKNKLKIFDVSKLRGYFQQKILSSMGDLEELGQGSIIKQGAKRSRSSRGGERFVTSNSGLRVSAQWSPISASGPVYQNLKCGLSESERLTFSYAEPHPFPLKVDDKVELLCQDSGIRGCWFKCTILQISRKRMKVQYDDVQDEDGCGNLEEWIPAFRLATLDKLRMRCSGRSTIRPCPPSQDVANVAFEIGSPVDAQWNDGWWEGVITEIDNGGNDNLQVHFPGEDLYSTFERKDLRISRDWVGNQWVDVATRPDILCLISTNGSPGMKLSASSTIAKGTESGSSGMSEREAPTVPKLDTVEEDNQELTGPTRSDGLMDEMKCVNTKKRPRAEDEGSDSGNEDLSEQVENKVDAVEEGNQELNGTDGGSEEDMKWENSKKLLEVEGEGDNDHEEQNEKAEVKDTCVCDHSDEENGNVREDPVATRQKSEAEAVSLVEMHA